MGQLPTERNDSPGVEERRAVADVQMAESHGRIDRMAEETAREIIKVIDLILVSKI